MSALWTAIVRHAEVRPDVVAIDGAEPITWHALKAALPILVSDVAKRFDVSRPLATRVDYGVAECLLDLAIVEGDIVSIPLPPFFSPAQVAATLEQAGASGLVKGTVAVADSVGLEFCVTYDPVTHVIADLPEGTARITFTSGSTGDPKGVCLSMEHLCRVAGAVVAHLGTHHAGRHLPLLPPGILLENVAGFYATILAGGTYVALPQTDVGMADPFRPDFAKMLEAIEENVITSLILVPEYLAGLVGTMVATDKRLPRLTLVAVGGARIEPKLLEAAVAVGLPVRQGYGLTECGSVVALDSGEPGSLGSVGQSIGANAIRLADDGEIIIDGPVFLGTIGEPRSPAPFATGDIGRIDEAGRLWIEGRKSSLIVTSHGRNISPEWVEGVLRANPAILQILVRGDGRAELDALIVPADPNADVAAAVAAANLTLPAYARVAHWAIVPPFTPAAGLLTGNGRLRRRAIQAAYPYNDAEPDLPFFERLVAETREEKARFQVTPQLIAGLTGRISVSEYIAYLTQAFHHVRHTVPLMQEARARLGQRPTLVKALDEYIEEETGHEFWILEDIDAAGGDAKAASENAPSPATKAMVDHAYRTIREGNPAAFFGMVYVLEGTSIAMASHGAGAVQASLGLPEDAFHYLTSHGAVDQDHMLFFERLMNRIDDPGDQQAIVAMARDMFGLFGGLFASIDLEALHVAA